MTSKFRLTTRAYDICWARHALSARELTVVKTVRLSACVELCCGVLTVMPVNFQLSRGMPHLACTMDAQYVVDWCTRDESVYVYGKSIIAQSFENICDFQECMHMEA
ncbi:hypothetical protein EGR_10061 [Echinococcus granulosus]|uniref:Uncharacterized protein n=1 Tax=Echinococcus granulosus TaxID=6210 RepID=W6UNX3_ECHGR|nr:hypothetical protein EGR_10061 [Echinococcus granulosus]EUB55094.1 hypothetical protein EGR_10061 [Echinococcus granulosus]